jgi:hypothetical protein
MGRFKWSAAEKFWNMPAYNSESEDDSEEISQSVLWNMIAGHKSSRCNVLETLD